MTTQTDRQKLLAHLESLQKAGSTHVTLDIAWLRRALGDVPAATKQYSVSVIELDGGKF
jgi:hypothetical protein